MTCCSSNTSMMGVERPLLPRLGTLSNVGECIGDLASTDRPPGETVAFKTKDERAPQYEGDAIE